MHLGLCYLYYTSGLRSKWYWCSIIIYWPSTRSKSLIWVLKAISKYCGSRPSPRNYLPWTSTMNSLLCFFLFCFHHSLFYIMIFLPWHMSFLFAGNIGPLSAIFEHFAYLCTVRSYPAVWSLPRQWWDVQWSYFSGGLSIPSPDDACGWLYIDCDPRVVISCGADGSKRMHSSLV